MIPAYLSPLFNHLWQSTLFAAVAGLLATALKKNQAQARYRLWLIASVKFLIPFSLLVVIGGHLSWSTAIPITQPQLSTVVEQIAQPFPQAQPAAVAAAPLAHSDSFLLAFVLLLWTCGFLVITFSWTRRWRRIRAAVHAASPLSFEAEVPVLSSPALIEPGVFGIFRPVLLLPEGIRDRLAPEQLEAIIAHELCHVQRRDNLAAAIHMLVEAIFWFHPLVWWMGTRLVEERERACDEEVLRLGNEPQAYAESILKTCEFCVESQLACVSGVTGGDLKKRIVRIMTKRVTQKLDFGRRLLLTTAGIAAVAGPIAFGLVNAPQSRAQSEPSTVPRQAFEVASIKPNKSGGHRSHIYWSYRSGRLTVINVGLQGLIERAYGVMDYQISGPGWLKSEQYDIAAEAAGSVTEDQLRTMLQALLADRFKVAFHRTQKVLPVYELVVAKNGPKLQKTAKGDGHSHISDNGGHLSAESVSMAQFAESLFHQIGRPVLDKTGLQGVFNFKLEWTPDENQSRPEGQEERGAITNNTAPSIFTALQEQLGLKLEGTKGPVELLVIDHVEKPSEN